MDYLKTPNKYNFFENKKSFHNIKLKTYKTPDYNTTNHTKRIKINDVRPADPLINRKVIKDNPIKYPTDIPMLKLPYFNYNSINKIKYFELNPKINNVKNYDFSNKDIQINNYINMNKMIQRLIYTKKPPDRDGHVTIENIINLNYINNLKEKKKKKVKIKKKIN